MLVLLSPAKSLDMQALPSDPPVSQARALPASARLIEVLRTQSTAQLRALMALSDALARLNHERYAAWRMQPDHGAVRVAALAFAGDVYEGLRAQDWDATLWARAQVHLRLLSGLYGVLRPQDALQAYRLEMGTPLAVDASRDLYAFWRPTIGALLQEDLVQAGGPLVNLASQEYFKAVDVAALATPVIAPRFLDARGDGPYRIVSFYAKRARGSMADWILRQAPRQAQDLQDFAVAGYRYDAALSQPQAPCFVRRLAADTSA